MSYETPPGKRSRAWLAGRGSRREYLLGLPLLISGWVFTAIFHRFEAAYLAVDIGLGLMVLVLMIRRLHDLGLTGFIAIGINFGLRILSIEFKTFLTPTTAAGAGMMVTLIAFVALGLVPGEPGDNRFGPPPGRLKTGVAEVFN
jgi:uncharacterized membrane protein YhaH (DUF805 family)